MWSYYTQNYEGIVLRFIDDTPGAFTHATPVRYVSEMPSLYNTEGASDMLADYNILDKKEIMDT
jgi:hypothetical protein